LRMYSRPDWTQPSELFGVSFQVGTDPARGAAIVGPLIGGI